MVNQKSKNALISLLTLIRSKASEKNLPPEFKTNLILGMMKPYGVTNYNQLTLLLQDPSVQNLVTEYDKDIVTMRGEDDPVEEIGSDEELNLPPEGMNQTIPELGAENVGQMPAEMPLTQPIAAQPQSFGSPTTQNPVPQMAARALSRNRR